MTRAGNMFMGAVIGGAIGFVIGSLIAEKVAPEYYTEEELLSLEGLIGDEGYVAIEDRPVIKVTNEDGSVRTAKVDYGKFYKKTSEENQLTLTQLANLKNRQSFDDVTDRKADDQMEEHFTDDGEYVDEEDVYEEIPFLDYSDLSSTEPTDFIDLRDDTVPHIITEDEYDENEYDYRRTLLKYYSEDGVLTSEDDRPVENIRVVGDYALDNFGVFTDQGDLVFVCNPQLRAIYKVIDMGGSYEEKVLGAAPKQVVVRRNVFDDDVDEDVARAGRKTRR